ncbi:hypothetical protein M0R88_12520 [Halorussus gelatinilyticus]|uniref:Uncharacterized protein n=1 Tax=Halorussus gelatinilyticus TaxID=2937524 RepID=A0A8U0IF90_9EURY|nr:hypothetical protein [Halorussus gelatinilyticus]UPV99345.1 hypothetical protein M0R88_12520 [Halorussus gelatinilyticus]
MSRSSGSGVSDYEPRESDRAQVEPTAALVAVFAVGVALTAYTGLLGEAVPTSDRNLADPTVERTARAISETGVADPESLAAGLRSGPEGYRLNLTLRTAGRSWRAGPTPPPRADTATVAVSVRIAPGRVRPGHLRAEVWS